MKPLSEKQALAKLRKLKDDFRAAVTRGYEHRAKSCETCETKGACCTDEHFVNVHITRLEAILIRAELKNLSPEKQIEFRKRISQTIEKYDLRSAGDSFEKTFACPLFEKASGCTVHAVKPAACIAHACYERREDLPPEELQTDAEAKIERLNEQTYKKFAEWRPLPVWLDALEKS